jgi:hypothetical protein
MSERGERIISRAPRIAERDEAMRGIADRGEAIA